jgi:hypothetical protein
MSIESTGRIRNGSGGTVSFVDILDEVVDGQELVCRDVDAPDHFDLVRPQLLQFIHRNKC